MANSYDIQRLDRGDKNLQNADFGGVDFLEEGIYKFKDVDFREADFRGANIEEVDGVGCDFREAKFYRTHFSYATFHKCDFRGVKFNRTLWGRGIDFQDSDLEGASGIPLETLYGFPNEGKHKGETVEEKARREEEKARREEEERLRREEEERLRKMKKERNRVVSDLMNQIDKAKKDKELEALAQEVGSLQAQPEYVKEYKHLLDRMQSQIEEKYSVIGKGLRYLKRLFSKGRRASQTRTASQMLKQLNKEIVDLKKEL